MTDYDPRRPLLQPNEVAVFHGLFQVESRFKIKQSYFETERHSTMRRHAIACIQKYSDCPDFDAFTPYLAMNYYDSFLSDHSLPIVIIGDFLKNLNLFVICCLTIAWKMRSKSFSVTKFQNENELEFASKDLMKMELHILNTLKWRMRSFTPICFAKFFFSQLKPTGEQLKTRPVFIIIIRSQNNIAFTQFRPSVVAASAVLKHLSNVSPEQLDDFKETSCTFVPADELKLCLEEMEKWYKIQFGDGGGGGGPPEKRLSETIDIPGARGGASSSSAAGGGGGGGGADSLPTLLDAARPSIAFRGQRPGKDTVAEEDEDVEEKEEEEEDVLSSLTSASGDASPAPSGRRPGKEPVVEEEKKERAAKEEIKEAEEEFLMNFPLEWTSDDIKKTAKALSKEFQIGAMEIAEHDESKCYPDTVATAHITDDPEQVYKEKAQKKLENFQIHVKERFRALIARSDPLSLSWIRQLFKVFLSCLKEFKELLDHNGRDLKRGVRNRLISPCVFICLRSLELLNGIRDGLLYVEEWGGEVLNMLLLLCTPNVGRPQFDKARNALNRLSISIQNEKESNWALADSMEENEGNLNLEPARRFSSRVSRMWSASMQLKLLRTSLFLPTLGDNAVTNGIADSAFTMGCVQFTVLFCLVAAVPCQGRRIDASFFEEHMSPYRWYEPLHSIWKKIYEEARKAENLYCCGLLNEVCLIEQCTRDLSNLINSVEYPLTQENREERAQVVKKLRNIDAALEDGLEPLDEELKDGWSKIASFRIEVENWKNWLHG